MNLEQVKRTLNSNSGRELKKYLLSKLNELKNIDNLKDLDTPTHLQIEVKAQVKAHRKLKEIFSELMDIGQEAPKKKPEDSYIVE